MSRVGVVYYRQEVKKKSCIPFLVELGREISVIGMIELIGSAVGTHLKGKFADFLKPLSGETHNFHELSTFAFLFLY